MERYLENRLRKELQATKHRVVPGHIVQIGYPGRRPNEELDRDDLGRESVWSECDNQNQGSTYRDLDNKMDNNPASNGKGSLTEVVVLEQLRIPQGSDS